MLCCTRVAAVCMQESGWRTHTVRQYPQGGAPASRRLPPDVNAPPACPRSKSALPERRSRPARPYFTLQKSLATRMSTDRFSISTP